MAFSGNTYTLPAGANTAAAGQVVQSAVWNSIHNDFSTAFNTVNLLPFRATGVNFNAIADTAIAVVLPNGFTRYRVGTVFISHASASLTASTVGLFTAVSGGGTAIVTSSTAVTVNTATDNANNNMQLLTVNNQNTQSFNVNTLYFRVTGTEGSAATADVSLILNPLP